MAVIIVAAATVAAEMVAAAMVAVVTPRVAAIVIAAPLQASVLTRPFPQLLLLMPLPLPPLLSLPPLYRHPPTITPPFSDAYDLSSDSNNDGKIDQDFGTAADAAPVDSNINPTTFAYIPPTVAALFIPHPGSPTPA